MNYKLFDIVLTAVVPPEVYATMHKLEIELVHSSKLLSHPSRDFAERILRQLPAAIQPYLTVVETTVAETPFL